MPYFTPGQGLDYNSVMGKEDQQLAERAQRLVGRLERLSADSSYAHQASGLRGAILRGLAARDSDEVFAESDWVLSLVERGEQILVQAARQIPETD